MEQITNRVSTLTQITTKIIYRVTWNSNRLQTKVHEPELFLTSYNIGIYLIQEKYETKRTHFKIFGYPSIHFNLNVKNKIRHIPLQGISTKK